MTEPRVICIDDDEDLLAGVARVLRARKLDVLATTDPAQVLAWLADQDIAVLVSDVEMPAMSGVELVAKAREIAPSTTRILLTGQRNLQAAIAGINRGGVFRYIAKPFERADLETAVDEGIAHHRELAAVSTGRAHAEKREKLRADLEASHPGITDVARDSHGIYVVASLDRALLEGVGLAAILASLTP